MSRWSEWINIGQNASYKGCGVYKIRLADTKGSPIEIPRFLDKDKDGILQIGNSEDIGRRIKYFRGAMEGKRYAHVEGQRLSFIKRYTSFMERYKDCKLQYSFKRLQNESEVQKEEERLLKCYFKKYGEVPPLNNNLPDKDIDWKSLNCD